MYSCSPVNIQLVNISLKSVGCILSGGIYSQALGDEGETCLFGCSTRRLECNMHES